MLRNIKAIRYKDRISKSTARIYYEDSISRIRNAKTPFIYCSTLVDIGVQVNYDNLTYRDLLSNNNYYAFSSYIFTVMVCKALNVQ